MYGIFSKPNFIYPENYGWKRIRSKTGKDEDAFYEIEHDLGRLPVTARVYVKILDGDYKDYIIEAKGFNTFYDGNPTWTTYGGFIYAYNDKNFRIWIPNDATGHIVHIYDGLGENPEKQLSDVVEFRIVAW